MKYRTMFAAAAVLSATTALAEGDPAAGEAAFKQCIACHTIADGDNVINGRGRTGPNLFGIVGRQAGTAEGFDYGESLVAAGEKGLVWDAETFAAYVTDPRAFLQEYLDDKAAKSGMSFRLRKGAEDVWAYLESVSPAPTN